MLQGGQRAVLGGSQILHFGGKPLIHPGPHPLKKLNPGVPKPYFFIKKLGVTLKFVS